MSNPITADKLRNTQQATFPNPLYPRPCGGAGAEGMKKQILAMGLVKWGSGNFRQG